MPSDQIYNQFKVLNGGYLYHNLFIFLRWINFIIGDDCFYHVFEIALDTWLKLPPNLRISFEQHFFYHVEVSPLIYPDEKMNIRNKSKFF